MTDGRTDGGDCNIPIAFLKKRGDNKQTNKQTNIYRRVVRMFANSDMYVTADDLKVFCCFH